jgi:hypothetical protein
MSKKAFVVALLLIAAVICVVLLVFKDIPEEEDSLTVQEPVVLDERVTGPGHEIVIPVDSHKSPPGGNLFGDRILQGFGSGPPVRDIQLMGTLLSNYRMLAKGVDPRHYSTNEGVAEMLKGQGIVKLPALSEDHPVFNKEGLIVDRWGEPWLFHSVSSDRLDIYSPGEDGEYGTDDDLSLEQGRATMGKVEL